MQAASHATLSNLVEGHLTTLVRESAAVNRHSRRGGRASAAGGPAAGPGPGGAKKRRRLVHHDDVNLALSWRGADAVHVSAAPGPASADGGDGGGRPRRVDLNAYLRSDMAVGPPSELGMTVHWLAVEGVSPMDPRNEVYSKAVGAADINKDVTPALLLGDGQAPDAGDDGEDERESIRIRELQHRLLSEELQLYYSRVTSAVATSDDADEVSAILRGVSSDAGIQELVPFLSRFVSAGLGSRRNLVRTEYCRRLVRLFDAMLDNQGMHLDLHLHQMLTPVSTCVVAKRLSSSPHEDHWALRSEAGAALVKACERYGPQYATMKPRVVRMLATQALRPDRPAATQYGGITALGLFGPRAVDAFLLPAAGGYWERWEKEMDGLSRKSKSGEGGKKRDARAAAVREDELSMCQQAMLDAMRVFLQEVSVAEQAGRVSVGSLSDVFGERLIPMQTERSDYMLCVL